MNSTHIETEKSGPIGYIVLNRPERRNALTSAMVEAFNEALRSHERDETVRVIVIRGEGPSFCSGFDLNEAIEVLPTLNDEEELEWIDSQRRVFERLWRSRKPTIAQVHGFCVGGGLSIATFCDIIVATHDAQFGQPESRDSGYSSEIGLWPYTIGPRHTKELLMTGGTMSGERGERLGLVNHSVEPDQLATFTHALATRIAATHPQMLNYSKRLVNHIYDAMGIQTSWDFGALMNLLGHHSEAMNEFTRLAQKDGLKAALKAREATSEGTS